MSALSAERVLEIIQHNDQFIRPFHPVKVKEGLSYGLGSTYDLRLADSPMLRYKESEYPLSAKRVTMRDVVQLEYSRREKAFIIPARTCALGVSLESVDIPHNVLGLVMDKSTYARTFLYFLNTLYDPGFNGYGTLECCNGLHRPQYIYPNEGVVQMLFLELDRETERYYKGKYQGQERIVTLPKAM